MRLRPLSRESAAALVLPLGLLLFSLWIVARAWCERSGHPRVELGLTIAGLLLAWPLGHALAVLEQRLSGRLRP